MKAFKLRLEQALGSGAAVAAQPSTERRTAPLPDKRDSTLEQLATAISSRLIQRRGSAARARSTTAASTANVVPKRCVTRRPTAASARRRTTRQPNSAHFMALVAAYAGKHQRFEAPSPRIRRTSRNSQAAVAT